MEGKARYLKAGRQAGRQASKQASTKAGKTGQGRSDELAPSSKANGGSKWLSQTRAPAERLMLTGSCSLWTRLTLLAWPGWLMLWHLVQPIPKARR